MIPAVGDLEIKSGRKSLNTVEIDYSLLDRGGNPRFKQFTAEGIFTEENGGRGSS